jgi:hypothetical protein
MKKWMMLLAGWLLLYGVVTLIKLLMKTPINTRGAEIALCMIAIVAGVLVFVDK